MIRAIESRSVFWFQLQITVQAVRSWLDGDAEVLEIRTIIAYEYDRNAREAMSYVRQLKRRERF